MAGSGAVLLFVLLHRFELHGFYLSFLVVIMVLGRDVLNCEGAGEGSGRGSCHCNEMRVACRSLG